MFRLLGGNIRRVLYPKQRLTIIGNLELLGIEESFRKYRFEWMTRAHRRYSKVLICEFYAAYKGEHHRKYPLGQF